MIEIRRARRGDLEFILEQSLEAVVYGIPEGRDIPNEVVVETARKNLEELESWLMRKGEFAILVAEDKQKGCLAGFLILEFNKVEESTGEAQSFIYNLVVASDYFGRYVGHNLVRAAAKLSYERGYRYMTSKVTATNERTLLSALKLGFEIERYQLTMACGPEGPAKLPGRPMHQRGHAISRLLRQRKRQKGDKS